MATPCSLVGMDSKGKKACEAKGWQWLLCLGIMLIVVACGSEPNRVEILQHKKETLAIRKDKDRFFKTSQDSPLLTEQQMNFKELSYFPVDISYRVKASYQHLTKPIEFRIQTSTGHERIYSTIGQLNFSLAGKPLTLFAYHEKGQEATAKNSLFVPFTDLTSGKDSYGAGRYLDIPEPAGDSVVLDFNVAYHPYCAYNYNFSCPIPPPENRLEVAIKAGEKLFPLGQPLAQ